MMQTLLELYRRRVHISSYPKLNLIPHTRMRSCSVETSFQEVISACCRRLDENNRHFLRRVYNRGLIPYQLRVQAYGYAHLGRVLDAGCGFGQWTLALADYNRKVHAVDACSQRIDVLQQLLAALGVKNSHIACGKLEQLSYPDEFFDGIYCYSVIFLTDVHKVLREFRRLLKPGGKLYICANNTAWYLYNLIENPHANTSFSPRDMAKQAIDNSIGYYARGQRDEGVDIIVPDKFLREELQTLGFCDIAIGHEGHLCKETGSFFPEEKVGHRAVYEVIAIK